MNSAAGAPELADVHRLSNNRNLLTRQNQLMESSHTPENYQYTATYDEHIKNSTNQQEDILVLEDYQ